MKARYTSPKRDLFRRPLTEEDWRAIKAAKRHRSMPRKVRPLLRLLSEQGNKPCGAGRCHRSDDIGKANQVLRRCGRTGYYLVNVNQSGRWKDATIQIWVRKGES